MYNKVNKMSLDALEQFNDDKLSITEYKYIQEYIQDLIYEHKEVKTFYENIANFFRNYKEFEITIDELEVWHIKERD